MRFLIVLLFLSCQLFSQDYATCFLNGQLGNQMFQIAATVSYALEHGCEAVFPDIRQARDGEMNSKYIFHRLNTSPMPPFFTFTEAHSNRYASIPYYPGRNIRLFGHFESEKYFEKHKEQIQELFAPTQEIIDQIHTKYGELLQEPTVAVHVRTFLTDGRNPKRVGIGGADWSYYRRAIDFFPEHYHLIVFSDAIQWTKKHFPRIPNRKITFIEGNPHYIDFYFISLCDHQIISPESTFSWWAAWLNKNPHKTVILPDTWNDLLENDTIPAGWIAIKKRNL